MEDPSCLARCVRNECQQPIGPNEQHIYGMCLNCYNTYILEPKQKKLEIQIDNYNEDLAECYRKKTEYENLTIDQQTFASHCDAHNAPILSILETMQKNLHELEPQCQNALAEYKRYESDYSQIEYTKGYEDIDYDSYINSRNPTLKPIFDKYNNMVHDILANIFKLMHNAHQFSGYGSSCDKHHPSCLSSQKIHFHCCKRHNPVCFILNPELHGCNLCEAAVIWIKCNCSMKYQHRYRINERDLIDNYKALNSCEKSLKEHMLMLTTIKHQ
jgi:hypothetical protein